jgi:tRNA threonylcarbamoyladenosine modification (KEOPS) complex  Pcc1 subunit
MITLELRFEYDDRRTAETVLNAIVPDNAGYVRSELQGRTLVLNMEAETAGTMKNTADDLLACIKIAEEASGLVPGTAADLDSDTLLE